MLIPFIYKNVKQNKFNILAAFDYSDFLNSPCQVLLYTDLFFSFLRYMPIFLAGYLAVQNKGAVLLQYRKKYVRIQSNKTFEKLPLFMCNIFSYRENSLFWTTFALLPISLHFMVGCAFVSGA